MSVFQAKRARVQLIGRSEKKIAKCDIYNFNKLKQSYSEPNVLSRQCNLLFGIKKVHVLTIKKAYESLLCFRQSIY